MSDPVVLLSTGDVVGPAGGVTDNSMVLFSGTSGKLIKGNNAQVTSAGLALLDDIDTNAQLTTLGLTTTQPQFDNSVKQATTEFVQRALGNIAGFAQVLSLPATLPAANAGKLTSISSSATETLTLPPLANTALGGKYYLSNNSSFTITVAGASGQQINAFGINILSSFTMLPGDTAVLISAGDQWVFEEGTKSLEYAPVFGASLAANGWQKLPRGLIIQWGRTPDTNNASFPIAFPTAALAIYASYDSLPTASQASTTARILTKSTFSASWGTVNAEFVYWLAVGY